MRQKHKFAPEHYVVYLLCLAAAVLCIISVRSTNKALNQMAIEESVESNKKTLELIRMDITARLSSLSLIAENIKVDDSVQSYVAESLNKETDNYATIRSDAAQKLFYSTVYQNDVVYGCCIVCDSTEYIIQNPYIDYRLNDEFVASALKIIGTRNIARFICVENGGKSFCCYYSPIYTKSNPTPAKLLIVVNERLFGNVFGSYKENGLNFYCTDHDGHSVYHSTISAPIVDRAVLADSPEIVVSHGEERMTFSSTVENNSPFCLVLQVPYSKTMDGINSTFNKLTVFMVACIVLVALLYSFSVRKVYARIAQIKNVLADILKGNIERQRVSEKQDKAGFACDSVNQMLGEVKALVEGSTAKDLAVKKAQLRAVQMQINPHFLFNTLETIRMVALYNQDSQAAHLVKDLSDVFRYSISSSNPVVSVEQEFNHAMKYLEVQKSRIKDAFSVEIDVDAITLNYALLRLTMQPLLENAISHGIQPKNSRGVISISCHIDNGFLDLTIQDTGIGMKEEELAALLRSLDEEDDYSERHIGLSNVKKRIELYFGKTANLEIESVYQRGTRVTLHVPAIPWTEGMSLEDPGEQNVPS